MNTETRSLHPCLAHHEVYAQACRPLERLGVNFFGYTAVDTNDNAYCLGSKTDYAEKYLAKKHVSKDVHFLQHSESQKPSYFFWDYAELNNDEEAVYKLAHDHQQAHTLTITKQTATMTHCYHFSGHPDDEGINQRFLDQMDYLHTFIDYFDYCLTDIDEISSIYKHPTNVPHKLLDNDFHIISNDPRELQFKQATSHLRFKNFAKYYLTDKERICLYWLQHGKSFPIIAQIMDLSVKSIERHIASIKQKYDCYTLYQLGQKIAISGLNELLEKNIDTRHS